jgi:membrane protein
MADTTKPSLGDRARGRVRRLRSRRAGIDHAFRAYDRNTEAHGSHLAGAITYFGFLSFFPLLAVSFSVLGYVVEFYPGADDQVSGVLMDTFPGLIGSEPGQINVQDIADARAGAGIIGLLGLLYSGLGWVDATREALRQVFGLERDTTNIIKRKLLDVGVLLMLGISILLTVAVSSVTTSATTLVLGMVGLQGSIVATVLLRVLALAVALALNMAIFAVLLSRLGGTDTVGKRPPWRRIRSGALLGAVGFELLKLLVTFLIGNTLDNELYGAFAVIVALLVWMNFVARLLVFAAAWTTTEPYSLQPDDGYGGGAGRVTPLASGTEPVLAVAPPPEDEPGAPTAPPMPALAFRGVPTSGNGQSSAAGDPGQAEGGGRRRQAFAVGAVVGGAAVGLASRRGRSRPPRG